MVLFFAGLIARLLKTKSGNYAPYFSKLNDSLKNYKKANPFLLIDLNVLDENLLELKKLIPTKTICLKEFMGKSLGFLLRSEEYEEMIGGIKTGKTKWGMQFYACFQPETELMASEILASKTIAEQLKKIGKPNYNSFVNTFAYNIVNNIKSQYNTNPISLCFVLDAIKVIDNQKNNYKLYHTNVKEVYDKLNNIGNSEFDKKLSEILDYYKNIKQ